MDFPRAILFDCDGVLRDSFPQQFAWFQHISGRLGKPFPYPTAQDLRRDYREPVYPDLYQRLGFDWETERNVIWDEYHRFQALQEVQVFPGIPGVLAALGRTGIPLAIASSSTRAMIDKTLEQEGLGGYFAAVVGKEDLPTRNGDPLIKPHPAAVLVALDRLQVNGRGVVMIGDTPADVAAARAAAAERQMTITALAVTYGYTPREVLLECAPDGLADTPRDLLPLLGL